MSQRVPFSSSEKDSLHISLDRHRDAVMSKLESLTQEQTAAASYAIGDKLAGPGQASGRCGARVVLLDLRPPDRAAAGSGGRG
ncbi:MAG TPA: hypothetical protein VMA72_26845 [Streptosporangiaceae bacterium]|nr:hypothetical protein [Streptosporangiaceae bacterium]